MLFGLRRVLVLSRLSIMACLDGTSILCNLDSMLFIGRRLGHGTLQGLGADLQTQFSCCLVCVVIQKYFLWHSASGNTLEVDLKRDRDSVSRGRKGREHPYISFKVMVRGFYRGGHVLPERIKSSMCKCTFFPDLFYSLENLYGWRLVIKVFLDWESTTVLNFQDYSWGGLRISPPKWGHLLQRSNKP